MRLVAYLLFSGLSCSGSAYAQSDSSIQIHGSGSSVMSRCAWHVMEMLSSRTKIPVRATYRSVGSGSGQTELVGNTTHPYTDFASSDNPLTKERYELMNAAGAELIHLPVVMGAIAVFHSVDIGEGDESNNIRHLNLTSCLVARIFKGEIDDWTHPDIKEINPSLDFPVQIDFYGQPKNDQSVPIKVVHRARGSGSTFTFTSYLHKACPEHWEVVLTGESIEWPMEGSDRLIGVQGTSEIVSTIQGEPNVIGYADAGYALDEGLQEAALRMDQANLKEDFYLTSENAVNKDGLSAALKAEGTNIPERGDADWSGVDTINQVADYLYAWPMVAITYVIVRKDLPSFIPEPTAQSLLVAFFKALYDPEFISKCEEDYLFLPVPDVLRDSALASIELLNVSSDAPVWIKEDDVLEDGLGTGDFVISTRRSLASTVDIDTLSDNVAGAVTSLSTLTGDIQQLKKQSASLEEDIARWSAQQSNNEEMGAVEDLENRTDAGFFMAIVSLVLWFMSMLVMIRQQITLNRLQVEVQDRIEQANRTTKRRRSIGPKNTEVIE